MSLWLIGPESIKNCKAEIARGYQVQARILRGDCLQLLTPEAFRKKGLSPQVALTFFDPPFNQGKDYRYFDDSAPEADYWRWIKRVCAAVGKLTAAGGAIYFMQREKNTEQVLRCLRETGWTLQNLLVWAKRTSAVPGPYRFGKQYQIIVFATKGASPRVFHRLRIDAPLLPGQKQPRKNGLYVTDCWNDIRELTSGYFAGEEALRFPDGRRRHEQQSPVALLARVILSSTNPGDLVFDPCAGSGTTLVAAEQLRRPAVGIEIDSAHIKTLRSRLRNIRAADSLEGLRAYYRFTPGIEKIWPLTEM